MTIRARCNDRSLTHRAMASLLVWMLLAPPAALAAPTGAQYDSNSVAVERTGSLTTITAGDGATIDWQSFDIGAQESVTFIQPSGWARVLNRVLSTDPTQIDGALSANGQVYIMNPYGVYFGGEAIVDVGRLVAVAGRISDDDFRAGIDRFELSGRVENAGTIQALSVALLGREVANYGQVLAEDGAIVMAAGDAVWISHHGSPILIRLAAPSGEAADNGTPAVENTGRLDAGRGRVRLAAGDLLSFAIHQSGSIRAADIALEGGDRGLVEVSGTLDASDLRSGHRGGSISVTGDAVALRGATLDASGDAGGGLIRVGGDISGQGTLRRSQATWVDRNSSLRADAIGAGDGGDVIVWSDGATWSYGNISARGGALGGDGGFAETSGKRFLDTDGPPDLSAPLGRGGQWLLDPLNVRIVASQEQPPLLPVEQGLDRAFANIGEPGSGFVIFPEAGDSQVSAGEIAQALANGIGVTITTQSLDELGSQEGDISVEASICFIANCPGTAVDINNKKIPLTAPLVISTGTRATLTLDAADDIRFINNAEIDASGTALELSVLLQANGDPAVGQDDLAGREEIGTVDLAAGSAIRSNGGTVTIFAGRAEADSDDAITIDGSIDTAGGGLLLATQGGHIRAQAANLVSGGGSISLDARGIVGAGGSPLGGDIHLTGTLASGGGTVSVTSISGDIDIDAAGSAGGAIDTSNAAGTPGGDLFVSAAGDVDGNGGVVTITGDIQSGGGLINVGGRGTVGGAAFPVAGKSTNINGIIDSAGGGVVVGDGVIQVDITMAGEVKTGGGDFLAGGNHFTAAPNWVLDTRDLSSATPAAGAARIDHSGVVALGDGTQITAQSLELFAASDGSPDPNDAGVVDALTIGAGTTLKADEIFLNAGNAFSPIDDAQRQSRIAMDPSTTVAGLSQAAPTVLEWLQDGDLSDADLSPVLAAAGGVADKLRLAARDGALDLTTTIGGNTEIALGAATNITVGGALTPGTLRLEIAKGFTVDTVLASNLKPSDSLTISAGIVGPLESAPGAGDETNVDLVLANAVLLEAPTSLELHGRAGGGGDGSKGGLDFAGSATLRSAQITLRAGNGRGGDATGEIKPDLSKVLFETNAGGTTFGLTLRQDADLDNADLSFAPSFPPAAVASKDLTYRFQSDDGGVTIGDPAMVQGTNLEIAAAGVIDFASPVAVVSADIEGLTGLTADLALLESLDATVAGAKTLDSLTLRGGSGNLTLAGDLTSIAANRVRLVAGNGLGSRQILGLDGPSFGDSAGTGAPTTFVVQQDLGIVDTFFAGLTFADDATGTPDLPDQFGIRSTSIDLPSLATVAGLDANTDLVLEAGRVQIAQSDGSNVDFSGLAATNVEIRSSDTSGITFHAANAVADPAASAAVDFGGKVRLGGFDQTVADLDFTPATTSPTAVVVEQDGSIVGADLPTLAGGGDLVLYRLQSSNGDISLAPTDPLSDTDLTLSFEAIAGIDHGNPAGDLLLGTGTHRFGLLRVISPGDLDLSSTGPVTIDTAPSSQGTPAPVDSINIAAGNDGTGNLVLGANLTLRAPSITLSAGSRNSATPNLAVHVDARTGGPLFELIPDTEGNTSLVIRQDGDLDSATTLPAASQFVAAGTALADVSTYEIESRFGDLTITDPASIGAQEVTLSATFSDENGPKTVTIDTSTAASGDVSGGAGTLTIESSKVVLKTSNTAQTIVANSGVEFSGIQSLTVQQIKALVATDLPELVQFTDFDDPVGIDPNSKRRITGVAYRLETEFAGTTVVDQALGDRVAGSNLTLAVGSAIQAGTVEVSADPDVGSLSIEASAGAAGAPLTRITIPAGGTDEPTLETLGAQKFAGDLLIVGDQVLSANSFEFSGTVDGGAALSIQARGDVAFRGDIGASTPLTSLDIQFDEAVTSSPRVDFRADPAAIPGTPLPTRTVTTTGAVRIRNVDPDTRVADGRSRVPSEATIVTDGNLVIDAGGEIRFGPDRGIAGAGAGEKLSVAGTTTLRSGCTAGAPYVCSGRVAVGDVSTQTLTVEAGVLEIVRRARGAVVTPGDSSDTDSGVDLVANDFFFRSDNSGTPLAVELGGNGRRPVFGVTNAAKIKPFMAGFTTAANFPELRALVASDFSLTRTPDPLDPATTIQVPLDLRPRGSAFSDASEAIDEPLSGPGIALPPAPPVSAPPDLIEVGIETRPATAIELAGRVARAAIYDDASSSWRSQGNRIAVPRLDVDVASEALDLYREIIGDDFARAGAVRSRLAGAVADYRRSTGTTRVLGFELRRWLNNRPASQFEAYHTLRDLDRLFSAHRRSGLGQGEYQRSQRTWLEAITPEGIDADELGQAIHPTRYVRGSDILDIFGE